MRRAGVRGDGPCARAATGPRAAAVRHRHRWTVRAQGPRGTAGAPRAGQARPAPRSGPGRAPRRAEHGNPGRAAGRQAERAGWARWTAGPSPRRAPRSRPYAKPSARWGAPASPGARRGTFRPVGRPGRRWSSRPGVGARRGPVLPYRYGRGRAPRAGHRQPPEPGRAARRYAPAFPRPGLRFRLRGAVPGRALRGAAPSARGAPDGRPVPRCSAPPPGRRRREALPGAVAPYRPGEPLPYRCRFPRQVRRVLRVPARSRTEVPRGGAGSADRAVRRTRRRPVRRAPVPYGRLRKRSTAAGGCGAGPCPCPARGRGPVPSPTADRERQGPCAGVRPARPEP